MKLFLLVPFLAFFVVSCAHETPQKRIERNPQIYRSLNEAEKALVEVGKIQKGMSPAAVFLAWGSPDRRAEGQSEDNKRYEQWVYETLSPVVVQSAWSGFGPYGFGPGWGWRRGGMIGPGWGPWGWSNGLSTDIAYVPRTASWVRFINNRVQSWQLGEYAHRR